MNPRNLFAELKRRNVYKVAVAYAVVGWVAPQIATQIFPFLEIPNWVVRLVIVLIAIGFPIALVIAGVFEATPKGIKRTAVANALPVMAAQETEARWGSNLKDVLPKYSSCHVERSRDISSCWKFLK
jgi:hypothetical protein